jgi:hypothetical protein
VKENLDEKTIQDTVFFQKTGNKVSQTIKPDVKIKIKNVEKQNKDLNQKMEFGSGSTTINCNTKWG